MLSAVVLLGLAQTQEVRINSLTGKVILHEAFESKALGNQRTVRVYLPPSYESDKSRKFPVLYMHDGQNCFSGLTSYLPNKEWRADEAAEALIRANAIHPLIIVAVDNAQADRANEFLPTRFKAGNNELGGRADLYGRFLAEEVMPFVNKTYRTLTGPRNTALAGSSFGGIITYYLGMKQPDRYGKLGILSPSLWINNREAFGWVKGKTKQQIWLDMGGAEGPQATVQSDELNDLFVKAGWKPGRDLLYYREGFAPHNEDAWARRLPAMLMFFYRK